MFKYLASKEESLWEWLIDREWSKNPEAISRGDDTFTGWEHWVLNHWPQRFTISYWHYIFSNLEGTSYDDEMPRWIYWPVWGEWRYLGRHWTGTKGNMGYKYSLKSAWYQLTGESKARRLICRLRGHPRGEIFFNPGGDEPDHRCKDCGEEIG